MIHITLETRALNSALAALGTLAKKKTALPILNDVMLSYDNEHDIFRLMASDSEAWLELDMPSFRLIKCSEKEVPSCCLKFEKLREAISQLPSMTVQAYIDEHKRSIEVDYQTGKFVLPIEDVDAFPSAPDMVTSTTLKEDRKGVEPICKMKMPTEWLLAQMKAARVCVANDDLRPVMNTECLDVSHEDITLVASNGHTLYKTKREEGIGSGFLEYAEFPAGETRKLLIPKTIFDTLFASFSQPENITITADTQRLQFTTDGVTLTARQTEGTYPNYNSVIPKEAKHTMTVCRDTLHAVLKRVSIFANSSNLCVVERKENKLVISSDDVDNSWSGREEVVIDGDTTLPEGERYGFKISHLIGLLPSVQTENVVMQLNAPDKAMIMREEDKQSTLVLLVMPLLVK